MFITIFFFNCIFLQLSYLNCLKSDYFDLESRIHQVTNLTELVISSDLLLHRMCIYCLSRQSHKMKLQTFIQYPSMKIQYPLPHFNQNQLLKLFKLSSPLFSTLFDPQKSGSYRSKCTCLNMCQKSSSILLKCFSYKTE